MATFIVETMTALAFDRYDATEVQISCFNENTAGLLLYPKLGFLPFAVAERISLERWRRRWDSNTSAIKNKNP